MKTFISILSALLLLAGLGALAMPIAMFSTSRETGALLLILATITSIAAILFIATGVQYFRKKDKETALVVATTSGVLAWIVLNSQALKFTKGREEQTWQFAGLLIPIFLCYCGTKALKKSIRQKYEK